MASSRTRFAGLTALTVAAVLLLSPAADAQQARRETAPPAGRKPAARTEEGPTRAETRAKPTAPAGDKRQGTAPNGSNGTIHTAVSGCDLTVKFYGFDTGANSVVVTITDQDSGAVLRRDAFSAKFPTRTNGNTFDTSRTYTIPGTHHVKVVAEVTSAKGTATKQKVEWIRCAAAAATATGTARAAGTVTGATPGRATIAAADARRGGAAGAAGAEDDTRVMGTSFEREDPPAFAFSGFGLVRLLLLASALLLAGAAAVHFARRRTLLSD